MVFPIRSCWMFEVRARCQSFYCVAINADRTELECALTTLAHSLPPAQSIQEAAALTDQLKICTTEVGIGFHREYHERRSLWRCEGSAVETAMHVWSQHHDDPRVILQWWTAEFLQSFDATHPVSPAEKAASILRARFSDPPRLNALACEVGTSRSALVRDFRERYRMSVGEFLTRVRLRSFIDDLRNPAARAAGAAERAGYDSYHNVVDALRRRTGLTPGKVRDLHDAALCELLDVNLNILGRSDR